MSESPEPSTNDTPAPTRQQGTMRRYRLTIAYDGSQFHGWQKQHPPDREPLRTVQGEIETALQRLLGQRIHLLGASRTDTGVHALGQIAQFDAATPIPPDRLLMAINDRLPDDIEVRQLAVVPATFNVISDVHSKQYRYRIHNIAPRPLDRRFVVYHWWLPLDVDRMNDAARRLIGTHDFAGFAAAGHGRQSTIRTIFDCHVQRRDHEIHVVVSGDGFLYHMVRIMAGTLLEVGRGYFEPEQIDKILHHADRALAGPTLPPQGLWLEWVRYADTASQTEELVTYNVHESEPRP